MKRHLPVLVASSLAFTATSATLEQTPINATITAVTGIRVGHHTLTARPTGCTAILVDGEAVAGVWQAGPAPATRDTDLLNPLNAIDTVNGISLSGGSAFGTDAASGVVRYLDETNHGFRVGSISVPIVPAASLIDLWVGNDPSIRPASDCGYRAAASATTHPVIEGSVGAGAGATIGKIAGRDRAMKAGIGSSAIRLPNGLVVGAIVAVNAAGDVVDPATGAVIAGTRDTDGTLSDVRKLLRTGFSPENRLRPGENTTIGVVATNAKLTKTQATRVALMADDGYARAINPIHTTADGDTVFAVATGRWTGDANVDVIGALAADVMAQAILRAATEATSAAGIPAVRDLKR